MKNVIPDPIRLIKWKCPKCGYETITHGSRNLLSWLLEKDEPPTCDKCDAKMKRSRLL